MKKGSIPVSVRYPFRRLLRYFSFIIDIFIVRKDCINAVFSYMKGKKKNRVYIRGSFIFCKQSYRHSFQNMHSMSEDKHNEKC